MTAQEAQTTLGIESPFSTVELKSAHKNALVTWFPAQFMSDRAKLSQALEQTARIHEAYEMLLPMCQEEERKNANPWLDDALKQAYGQAPAGASAPAPSALQEATPDRSPSPESPSPSSMEPPAREESSRASRDVFAAWEKEAAAAFVPAPPRTSGKDGKRESVAKAQPSLDPAVPTLDKDAEPVTADSVKPAEAPAAPAPTPANPFLHDIVSLKKGGEGPKVELRGNSAAPTAPATPAPAATPSAPEAGLDSGSTVAPRMDTAITKVRPPKVVISPRLQGASVRPALPVVTVPVPLPPLEAPAPFSAAPLGPAAKVAPKPPESAPAAEAPTAPPLPTPVAEAPEAPPAPATVTEAPETSAAPATVAEAPAERPASAPIPETCAEPVAAEVPAPVAEASSVKDEPVVAAEVPPAVSPGPATEAAAAPASTSPPAPEPAHATPVSATVAEEASAVEQASHHVHATAATPVIDHSAVPAAIPAPKLKSKPKPAAGKDGEEADSETDEERAGDHALVPALGDRYHPAEKEGSPNTETSRHFPTRPVAPSRSGDESEDTACIAEDDVAEAAASPGRAQLNLWQRIYRFVLGGVCVVGVGYGIYWVSQSNIGRDPWGFEPGSGGPSDRIRQMAFEGLKQGAENGNVNAQLQLGRAYQKGETVAANPEEALKWFRKAAENGSMDAQYAMGDAYKSGSGVPQDNVEALKWYRMAEATREGQRTEEPKAKEEDVRLR